MKLTTNAPIKFNEWLDQLKRFADIEEEVRNSSLPVDVDTSCHADIIVDVESLIYPNFKCKVTYVQNWVVNITIPTFDEDGNKTGTQDSEQPHSKAVLNYTTQKSYEEIQPILEYVDTLIDKDLKGSRRLEAQVMKAILMDVVSHKTFKTAEYPEGLNEDQYTITH